MVFSADLTIGFLNINGLVGPTAREPEFLNLVESYDILCLTETWHSNTNDLLNENKFSCPPRGITFLKKHEENEIKRQNEILVV